MQKSRETNFCVKYFMYIFEPRPSAIQLFETKQNNGDCDSIVDVLVSSLTRSAAVGFDHS